MVNYTWQALRQRLGQDLHRSTSWGRWLGCLTTFIVVAAGWVVFRAPNLEAALAILRGMAGLNGFVLPELWLAK